MEILYAEDETVKISLVDDIVYYDYKVSIVDLAIQKKNLADRINNTGHVCRPIFIDSSNVKYWTKDARDYTMRSEHLKLVRALAFYYTSHVHKVILTCVRNSVIHKVPMELFDCKEAAVEWLKRYR